MPKPMQPFSANPPKKTRKSSVSSIQANPGKLAFVLEQLPGFTFPSFSQWLLTSNEAADLRQAFAALDGLSLPVKAALIGPLVNHANECYSIARRDMKM